MTDDDARLVDQASAVDVGEGYALAWSIGQDGDAWPLLIDGRDHSQQFVPYAREHFVELAPHELTGQLPRDFQQFWCGAATHNRRPCRVRVKAPSQRCGHHQGAAAADSAVVSVPRPTMARPGLRKPISFAAVDDVPLFGDDEDRS